MCRSQDLARSSRGAPWYSPASSEAAEAPPRPDRSSDPLTRNPGQRWAALPQCAGYTQISCQFPNSSNRSANPNPNSNPQSLASFTDPVPCLNSSTLRTSHLPSISGLPSTGYTPWWNSTTDRFRRGWTTASRGTTPAGPEVRPQSPLNPNPPVKVNLCSAVHCGDCGRSAFMKRWLGSASRIAAQSWRPDSEASIDVSVASMLDCRHRCRLQQANQIAEIDEPYLKGYWD